MNYLHFTDLKQMAKSPAHYKSALVAPMEPTKSMRIGTVVHQIVLGGQSGRRVVVFNGTRRGAAWDEFKLANANAEIVTADEWAEGLTIAGALLHDTVAAPMIQQCRFEVPLRWTDNNIMCETGGVDLVGPGWVADLKTTRSAEPGQFQRQAINMLYHAQLAFYQNGCEANNIDTSRGLYLIAVETAAPYCVTVHSLSTEVIALGHKLIATWMEKLRSCQDNDFWPGYARGIVSFESPAWMAEFDGEEEAA